MTARTPTGETLFRLAYGSEAVISVEVGLTSYRVGNHDESRNDEAMRLQLDLVDKVRATIGQRLARYQNLMVKHYLALRLSGWRSRLKKGDRRYKKSLPRKART